MKGNHLSDIWSLNLDKLDQFQNEKIIANNNSNSDEMKLAYNMKSSTISNIDKNQVLKSKINQSISTISFCTLPKPKAKINPIKQII